jgi:hypothetical protein
MNKIYITQTQSKKEEKEYLRIRMFVRTLTLAPNDPEGLPSGRQGSKSFIYPGKSR